MDSIQHVASWSVVILSTAILLFTVWSPQWLLWLMPLMILTARPASDVTSAVAYGVVGYLKSSPLIHDALHGLGSFRSDSETFVVYAIRFRTIAVAYQESGGERPMRRRSHQRRPHHDGDWELAECHCAMVYLAVALPLMIWFAFQIPAFESPDEPNRLRTCRSDQPWRARRHAVQATDNWSG